MAEDAIQRGLNVIFNPGQHVVKDLVAVGLVVQFVAAALKNLAGQVVDTGVAQQAQTLRTPLP